jgi:hypothetical protein
MLLQISAEEFGYDLASFLIYLAGNLTLKTTAAMDG